LHSPKAKRLLRSALPEPGKPNPIAREFPTTGNGRSKSNDKDNRKEQEQTQRQKQAQGPSPLASPSAQDDKRKIKDKK
jgi:hypothetical protein